MKINFHIHTTNSDGRFSVSEVVNMLERDGVKYFAITDHDNIDGLREAAVLAGKKGMTHINGVELSFCFDGEGGLDCTYIAHIVALGFNEGKMSEALAKIWAGKTAMLKQLFDMLVADGYKLRHERCFTGGVIRERKAIAKELLEGGYAPSINAAFNTIINAGKYLPLAKNLPTVAEGIGLIHDCGGLAIAAHPFGTARGGKKELSKAQVEHYISKLHEYGADGIEVFYQPYDIDQIEILSDLADKYGMIKSIGTDFHGVDEERLKTDPVYAEFASRKSVNHLSFDKEGLCPDENILKQVVDKVR